MESQKLTQTLLNCIFDFLVLTFFHQDFTINLIKLTNFFLVKKLTLLKKTRFSKGFEHCAFYGLGTEPSWSWNRSRNLSKVGTVKNSNGSATLSDLNFFAISLSI
jgi:hypothetical protein